VLGAVHDATPVYGSGGFCSYDDRRLAGQLAGWVEAGIPWVTMKIGRDSAADVGRVRVARRAVGDDVELFGDANGAFTRKQALEWAQRLADHDIRWLEEPVSSDDLEGLRLLHDRGPGGMDIAAGEYGYDLPYFHHMLDAGAVDCLQTDVTRCGGLTAVSRVAALRRPQRLREVCVVLWEGVEGVRGGARRRGGGGAGGGSARGGLLDPQQPATRTAGAATAASTPRRESCGPRGRWQNARPHPRRGFRLARCRRFRGCRSTAPSAALRRSRGRGSRPRR
jgi:hypothetical protein